jgi:geranylgeranyl diphosphate synthase type II
MSQGAMDHGALEAWLAAARERTELELKAWLGDGEGWPDTLHEATSYALLGGGKRLRPAMVRMFCEQQGGHADLARSPAVAIEMVHTYSLVHDDLPCMDDDDLRRGRPTCHKVYGEAMGVLVGDALLTEAFGVLGEAPDHGLEMVNVLARAAGGRGMVGGQVLDMTLPVSLATAQQVRLIHQTKTADLIGAACELGVLCAGADADRRAAARSYGHCLGLAFQVVDDVLDVEGDATTLGKTPGKDEALERATTVAILGLEGARRLAAQLAQDTHAAARRMGLGPDDLPSQLVDLLLARRK